MATIPAPVLTATSTPRVARRAAWAAVLALGVNALIGALSDAETLLDHSRGAGALSEITAGMAFLAGAVALHVLTPVSGWRRGLWMLAPLGLAIGGLTMVAVPVAGAEPPTWLFLLAVLPTLVGTVAAGVLGTRERLWPWWTGVALSLFLPIMFTLPFNSLVMAAVWASVAATAGRPGTVRPGERPAPG